MWASFNIDHGAIRSGQLAPDDWTKVTHATTQLMESGFFVDETPTLSASRIAAIAKKLFRTEGKMPIFIDYLQIMGSDDEKSDRFQEVTKFSMAIKAMAKNLNVPVVVLSQLNRGVESRTDKRPKTADLRESGAIEQDAGTIMFIYRDEVYNPEGDLKGTAEILIPKNRNGVTGEIPMIWQGQYQRFSDMLDYDKAKFYQAKSSNKPNRGLT